MVCDFIKSPVGFLNRIQMTIINKNELENNTSSGNSGPSHFMSSLIFSAKYTNKNTVLSHKLSSCIPTHGQSPPHLTSSSCTVRFPNTPLSHHPMFCYNCFWPGFCLPMGYVNGHSAVAALLSPNTLYCDMKRNEE